MSHFRSFLSILVNSGISKRYSYHKVIPSLYCVMYRSFTCSNVSSNEKTVEQPRCVTEENVEVTFIKANGDKIKAKGKEGDTLLDLIVNNNLDFDGYGACEGTLTCSTCHVVLSKEDYNRLPEKPSDEELDMLDLAYDLTDTSRLGCQIELTKSLNGLQVRVPATVNDARES